MSDTPMAIGFLEPHLLRFGGIRRILELANRLVDRGHQVTIYVPAEESRTCTWMDCRAAVRHIEDGLADQLDVLFFNDEAQWYLLRAFRNVRRRAFFALHFAALYDKPGSWEAPRAPVDFSLANSEWTASMIEQETGRRPHVLRGGVNPEHFHPVDVPKAYPILCVGDDRPWKGTDTVRQAGRLLDLPVETYAERNLPQSAMAREYGRAEVFVVGSRFEGFGQPGLEALACGTPLVTTDNGGARDYAVDGQTALVVPPDDPQAMAAAIRRLRHDSELAARLRRNGLALVAERYDWDRSAAELEQILRDQLKKAPATGAAPRPLREAPNDPLLTVVVLTWDQLHYTQRCVQSIRQHTDVPYELVIVDNGSAAPAALYAEQAADVAVLNPSNLGFSHGMNQGLALARGSYVAFLNNDTALPPQWASRLLSHWQERPRTGIVVPAVTAAGNLRTVQTAPRDEVEVLAPFEAPPSAVLYLLERETARGLGGWGEEFAVASAEDVDLCFKVWVNGLDIVFDRRVLVDHVSKGTAGTKLPNYRKQWAHNREVLLAKWTAERIDVPRLDHISEQQFDRNLETARSVAGWMRLYFHARRWRSFHRVPEPVLRVLRKGARVAAAAAQKRRQQPLVRRGITIVKRNRRARSVARRLLGR